jgi:hypothetical protein
VAWLNRTDIILGPALGVTSACAHNYDWCPSPQPRLFAALQHNVGRLADPRIQRSMRVFSPYFATRRWLKVGITIAGVIAGAAFGVILTRLGKSLPALPRRQQGTMPGMQRSSATSPAS